MTNLKKKFVKVLNTIESESSYAAIFYDISKRHGIDQAKVLGTLTLLLDELESIEARVHLLEEKK